MLTKAAVEYLVERLWVEALQEASLIFGGGRSHPHLYFESSGDLTGGEVRTRELSKQTEGPLENTRWAERVVDQDKAGEDDSAWYFHYAPR